MTNLTYTLTTEQYEAKLRQFQELGFDVKQGGGSLEEARLLIEYSWKSPVMKLKLTGRGMLGAQTELYGAARARTWFANVQSAS